MVVVIGVEATILPVLLLNAELGVQVKVFAPLAVKEVVCPEQIKDREGVIIIVGLGIMLTVETAELLQVPIVPVTVYEVVVEGLTIIEFVLAPVLQV